MIPFVGAGLAPPGVNTTTHDREASQLLLIRSLYGVRRLRAASQTNPTPIHRLQRQPSTVIPSGASRRFFFRVRFPRTRRLAQWRNLSSINPFATGFTVEPCLEPVIRHQSP